MVQHHLRFMLFLEFLKDQFSDHCSSSFTLTVLLTCRSLLRQISHSMLTTSYFTNRSETVMILHFCKLISTTYLTGQLEVVYLSTQPNVNLWLSQGKETAIPLSWDKHIHVLCTKAKKMLGLLYRSFYPNSSASSLLRCKGLV